MVFHAISQVKIDEILIGNTGFLSHCLEIGDYVGTHPDGYLLFEARRVRVPPFLHLGQIVFFLHFTPHG